MLTLSYSPVVFCVARVLVNAGVSCRRIDSLLLGGLWTAVVSVLGVDSVLLDGVWITVIWFLVVDSLLLDG